MKTNILFLLLAFLVGCQLIATVDRSKIDDTSDLPVGGSGGTSSSGGSSNVGAAGGNIGGQGGQGGSSTTSSGGSGGFGGQGGQGGTGAGGFGGSGGNVGGSGGQGGTGGSPPCETGIYLTVDSQGSGGNLLNSVGPVLSTSYVVHGTSAGNELNVDLRLVNNLTGDFTMPQATAAFEAVRIRCQDPGGANSYTVACSGPLIGGEYICPMPGCYSSSGGTVLMQLQVDPDVNGGGETARMGIHPTHSVSVCDDQSTNPTWTIQ